MNGIFVSGAKGSVVRLLAWHLRSEVVTVDGFGFIIFSLLFRGSRGMREVRGLLRIYSLFSCVLNVSCLAGGVGSASCTHENMIFSPDREVRTPPTPNPPFPPQYTPAFPTPDRIIVSQYGGKVWYVSPAPSHPTPHSPPREASHYSPESIT